MARAEEELNMELTLIGSGDMARAIGRRALAGGHTVAVRGTSHKKAEALAQELRATTGGSVRALDKGEAVVGDLVVLAVPYSAAADIIDQLGADLAGKVVVDITNTVDWDSRDSLVVPATSSGAEKIAARLPANAHVVKAFNTTFAATLVDGTVAGRPLDVLIAADDPTAKQLVSRLIEDGGMRAIDAGPLRRARQLEHVGFLHILLQEPLDTGYASTVALLS
jgi:8-hydroxy-5-deazaflavin:NADPH oxidoreductase